MAAVRKLPPLEELRQLSAEGLSNREIGRRYAVSGEAVRQELVKAGIRRGSSRPDYSRWLPWSMRADHVGDILARRLRDLAKREQGFSLRSSEERLLSEWLEFMEGANSRGVPLAVHYERGAGFWLEPRKDDDRDFIHPPDNA